MSYIVSTVEEFFAKLDEMQKELDKFSHNLSGRSDKVPSLIEEFERKIFSNKMIAGSGKDDVERAAQESFATIQEEIKAWKAKIEHDREGKEFIKQNEKYLVVMIFGAVKAGKSTLGNFFAGKTFHAAPFDNPYKHIAPPTFKVHSEGRAEGSLASDAQGQQWFTVGFVDTTGSIQYFTLSGLRWVDSPGTGAVEKEGDKVNMTALVDEYLSYTDMCIFLINSSEPGLQDDMKYMARLDKEGQEAIVVITRSDQTKVKMVADQNGKRRPKKTLQPKTPENRKLQEDDVRQRVKESYKVDERKFSMLSISTALADEAIAENDDEKFRGSNLDKLMKILGDKISKNTIERKQANPRRLLNTFVDEVLKGLKVFEGNVQKMSAAIDSYKSGMAQMAKSIADQVWIGVRAEINQRSFEWDERARSGGRVDSATISSAVYNILERKLNEEINSSLNAIIDGYQARTIRAVGANLSVGTLEKQTKTIERKYPITRMVERDTDGPVEWFRHNIFGKKYYKEVTEMKVDREVIDLGTNITDILERLEPAARRYALEETNKNLTRLRDTYFAMHERAAQSMRVEIKNLRDALSGLKYKD